VAGENDRDPPFVWIQDVRHRHGLVRLRLRAQHLQLVQGDELKVTYVGLQNPAAISYLNIHKYPGMQLIEPMISDGEMKINVKLGVSMNMDPCAEYEWKTYPRETLYQYMKEETIGLLRRALVDHTVGDLLVPFSIMSRNLFSNLGSVPARYTPGALPDTDDVGSNASGGMNDNRNADIIQKVMPNLSGSRFVQPNQNQSRSINQDQGVSRSGGLASVCG